MRLVEGVLDSVDWTAIDVPGGTGSDLAASLMRFVQAESHDRASELWWELEGAAFAQNTIYDGAEPTVAAMMASLAERPPGFLRPWIVEVLRFILSGGSEVDPSLLDRCRESAGRGLWLLAGEASSAETADYQEAVLEVVTLINPTFARVVRVAARADQGD